MTVFNEELVGKIRCWGISETTEEYLRRANAVCPVTAIQNRYSMLARGHEKLFPVLEELNVAYVAFSPLGNGFLTGKYDANSKFESGTDYRSHMPQYTKEGLNAAKELMEYLAVLADQKGAASSQISLAWMLCKKPYIIPIPGSRKEARLKENLGAKDIFLSVQDTEIKFRHTCSEYHPNKLSDESRGVLARESEKNAHKDPTTKTSRFWQCKYEK